MRRLSAPASVMGEVRLCRRQRSASQRSWSPRSPSRCRGFRCRRCSRSPPKSTLPQTSLFRECLPTHVAFSLRPSMLSLFNGRGRWGSPIGDSSALRSQPPRSAAAHTCSQEMPRASFLLRVFPPSFLFFRIRRHPSTVGDRNVGKSTVTSIPRCIPTLRVP
jgi:hypothetical protein